MRNSFIGSRKVGDMEKDEKKPDAATISGIPQQKIVFGIIAIAVVILAIILIAKFGYNIDLLNPASGEMSLVQRQATMNREFAINAAPVGAGDASPLANTDLQDAMQKQQQSVPAMINVSKNPNDTAEAVIQNIK
jgi:hypothetical protein